MIDTVDEIAEWLEREGYEDINVIENINLSAVKCYAHEIKLYYIMVYKAIGAYSFSEYGPDNEDYETAVFYSYFDLLNHLCRKNIIGDKSIDYGNLN